MNRAIDLAVGCHYCLPGLRLPPQLSPDGATCKRQHTSDSSFTTVLIYRPRKDERMSWPSWLICGGWFTHISGHPSAAGRAQDRESSPVRDRRSTTVPRHQLANAYLHKSTPKHALTTLLYACKTCSRLISSQL